MLIWLIIWRTGLLSTEKLILKDNRPCWATGDFSSVAGETQLSLTVLTPGFGPRKIRVLQATPAVTSKVSHPAGISPYHRSLGA